MCGVCGDEAGGIHYRVQTCHGCKGFWRRTIQRKMGEKYKCKVGTDLCQVTAETRSQCQRCRYLACVRAGMVSDIVMNRQRRLDREMREGKLEGLGTERKESRKKNDNDLFELFETIHCTSLDHIVTGDVAASMDGAYNFVETLMLHSIGQRDVRDLIVSAHVEVAMIHLLAILPSSHLVTIPVLGELAPIISCLTTKEKLLTKLLVASRPRMTWPQESRLELGVFWDMLGGLVKRTCSKDRMDVVGKVVYIVEALTHYFSPSTLVSILKKAMEDTGHPLDRIPNQVSSPVNLHTQSLIEFSYLPPTFHKSLPFLPNPIRFSTYPQNHPFHTPTIHITSPNNSPVLPSYLPQYSIYPPYTLHTYPAHSPLPSLTLPYHPVQIPTPSP